MLLAERITKRFGNLTALDNVSIEFRTGEIHAVLGANGAGKSTLMNILAGFMAPSEGQAVLDGKPLPLGNSHACQEAGMGMVHQHFRLVPEFTVAENFALARLGRLAKAVNIDQLAESSLKLARELGWEVDPQALVKNLPVGVQQRIEILKCLAGNASTIIFDEPTAVLSSHEAAELFRVLRSLTSQNKVVILIAHKLSEVMAIADRVTVLRSGKHVASRLIGDVDEGTLAHWMVGDLPDLSPQEGRIDLKPGIRVQDLVVNGDRGEEAVRSVKLDVRQGEILGIGGVDGNGQVELAETLALIRKPLSGSLHWEDRPLDYSSATVAYIPQDRQDDGLALSLSIEDNLLISGQYSSSLRMGTYLLSRRRLKEWATGIVEKFDIKVGSLEDAVSSLSGGNQQKIVVGRNLDCQPAFLVAVNPTRGLDVKATQFVHAQILQARSAGAAVVLFSTDLEELAALADRTLFMSRGKLGEGGAVGLVGGTT